MQIYLLASLSVALLPALAPSSTQSAERAAAKFAQGAGESAAAATTTSAPIGAPAWRKLATEAYRGKQDDIVFVGGRLGWYGNGAGKLFHTEDGGQTWTEQLHKPGTYFRCIAFVDEQLGFAGNIGPGYFPNVTDATALYRTRNGGGSWDAVTTVQGDSVVGLCAIEVVREPFVNAGHLEQRTRLVATGRVGGPAVFLWSDDLGETWMQRSLAAHAQMSFDVHFLDWRRGFIAAASDANVALSNGVILATEDGGATWNVVHRTTRPYELTWKISFPSRRVGYVTLQSYDPDPSVAARFIAKTVDGGKTWNELPLIEDAKVREFGVAFLDEDRGWVGAMPHGFATVDGGRSWRPDDMGAAVNKLRIVRHADSSASVFAIGVDVRRLDLPAPVSGERK